MQRTGSRPTGSWGAPMAEGTPVTVTVTSIRNETPPIRSFFFDQPFVVLARPVRDGLGAGRGRGPDGPLVRRTASRSRTSATRPRPSSRSHPATDSGSADRSATALPEARKSSPSPAVSGRPRSSRSPKADCVMTMLLGARTETELLFCRPARRVHRCPDRHR